MWQPLSIYHIINEVQNEKATDCHSEPFSGTLIKLNEGIVQSKSNTRKRN